MGKIKELAAYGKYVILPTRPRKRKLTVAELAAVHVLKESGLLEDGTTPFKQFAVFKYQDQFTSAALLAYANAVMHYVYTLPPGKLRDDWKEYADQWFAEAGNAENNPNRGLPS